MWLLDKMMRRLVKKGELVVTDHRGRVSRFGTPTPGYPRVAVRFRDSKVVRDIALSPRLGVAEAYMDGRLTFDEGDIVDLTGLARMNSRFEDGEPHPELGGLLGAFRNWRRRRNDLARARRNVAHHYDIGNPLYRLFLDRDMQYSCAYFTDPDESLEQAQEDKKAHIAAKLFLKPGQRVLDIGCGWGGLALYLHRHFDVDVLGITLSEDQLALARERAREAGVADRVRFELIDYRKVEGNFDRIVSVGMFEHVGAAHYDQFFAQCRNLLKPDGVMLLHTIGRFDTPGSGNPFADKYIFPGYHLPNLTQMVEASERHKLIAADVETLRLHYALTLREWIARTRAHKAEVVAMHDERFFRMWEVYLAAAMWMFEAGRGCVYQIQYLRSRGAVPITRDYLDETERALRARSRAEPVAARADPVG